MVVTQPLFSDDTKICSAGFIVENLEVDPVATSLEVVHNRVVVRDEMTITLILEGFYVDGVAAAVVGDHDLLIPTTRAYEETTHIISVYFADVGYLEVHFIGGNGWERFSNGGIEHWRKDCLISTFRLSGEKVLTRLGHVAF